MDNAMTPAAQFLLAKLLEEIDPMLDEDRPPRLSTLLRRLRNLRQRVADEFMALSADLDATQPVAPQPRPAVPTAEYRPSPMLSLGLPCPKCGKLIGTANFGIHEAFCDNWTEWSRKK